MPRKFEHLAQRAGSAVLKEPDNHKRPSPEVAPFDLDEAYPLRSNLGSYLTTPDTVRPEDGNPPIVLEHTTNPELTVWINRYAPADGRFADFFVLSCRDFNKSFYYEVPKSTVKSVLKQATDTTYWGIASLDDAFLEAILDEL
jgi:hypothetical protein